MKFIQACSPQSSTFLEPDHLQGLVHCYGVDAQAIWIESRLAKHTLAKTSMETTADVFKELFPLRQAFPMLLKLIQITLKICVTTASCERSFSAWKSEKFWNPSNSTLLTLFMQRTRIEESFCFRILSLCILNCLFYYLCWK